MSENTVITENTASPKYTVEYILAQIEKIAADTAYLHAVIKECSSPGAEAPGSTRTIGLGNIVECREKTNQKLIAFYEKVYDDLKPEKTAPKLSPKEQALQILAAKVASGDLSGDELQDILGTIRFLD